MTTKTKAKPKAKKVEWDFHLGLMGGGSYTIDGKGFYISYNPNPGGSGMLGALFSSDDGSDETALCVPKGRKEGGTIFLILNGDFRKDYEKLVPKGLAACKAFYEKNKKKHGSSWSQPK